MRLQVWAPNATTVDLALGDQRSPMQETERGYFTVEADIAPGDMYGFSLDGSEPLPDPRSGSQPQGVHGPSQVVDHSAFRWSDHTWCPDPIESWIIYELHIGTFTDEGTFDAAIAKLDYLAGLGISAIEIMPVNEFPGALGWGYDGVDLFAPHHGYGGPDALKRLVDAAHDKGLAVILDVVYNHFGPSGNYLPRFGPYLTSAYSTPWGDAVNLDDAGSDAVRAFIIDNALQWLVEYHFDALRIDAIHALLDRSAMHILEELSETVEDAIERVGRPLYLIAESDLNDPRIVTPRSRGGYGIDSQWSDDFHHALHTVLTGEDAGYYRDFGSIEQLAASLRSPFVYNGIYSPHRRRRHGRPVEGLSGKHFLGYAQNHDQVGNRATGDRLSHLVSPTKCKIAAAIVLTAPYIPMLFMGEEWGASTPFPYFTDHDDELGRAVGEGRKREFAAFGWAPADIPDPQDAATFESSKLDWGEAEDGHHKDILAWYRELIALRRAEPALTDGDLDGVTTTFDERDRWLLVQRGPFTIACNFGESPADVEAQGRVVLSSHGAPAEAAATLRLAPESVTILKR